MTADELGLAPGHDLWTRYVASEGEVREALGHALAYASEAAALEAQRRLREEMQRAGADLHPHALDLYAAVERYVVRSYDERSSARRLELLRRAHLTLQGSPRVPPAIVVAGGLR